MKVNIGSVEISSDTLHWIKIRAAMSNTSIRSTIAKILEREVSRSKSKWINDLELAAVERGLTTDGLWVLLLDDQPLPDVTDLKASIEIQLKQKAEGKLFEKE